MTPGEMSEVFTEWNKGELDSFLIEITRDILGAWPIGDWLETETADECGWSRQTNGPLICQHSTMKMARRWLRRSWTEQAKR